MRIKTSPDLVGKFSDPEYNVRFVLLSEFNVVLLSEFNGGYVSSQIGAEMR